MTQQTRQDRRAFLKYAGLGALVVGGTALFGWLVQDNRFRYNAGTPTPQPQVTQQSQVTPQLQYPAQESEADRVIANFAPGHYNISASGWNKRKWYREVGWANMHTGNGVLGGLRNAAVSTSELIYSPEIDEWFPQWGVSDIGQLVLDTPWYSQIRLDFASFPATHVLKADQNVLQYNVGGGFEPVQVTLEANNSAIASYPAPTRARNEDNPAPTQLRNEDIIRFRDQYLNLSLTARDQCGKLGMLAYFSNLEVKPRIV